MVGGFYSKYFLVPKRDGGLRPILDLRQVNLYLSRRRFKMLTLRQLSQSIRPGDWFTTVDLQDAYFHIPIKPGHQKYLRFAFQGKGYEFRVLPFGLSLAPRVFTKCMDAILATLRLNGIRVLNYLDDWLICAESPGQALQHTELVTDHLSRLGLKVNHAKSQLTPAQVARYLGLSLDARSMTAVLSDDRVSSISACLDLFQLGRALPVVTFQKLLGLMAAASQSLPLGLLHMRPLQAWFNRMVPHPMLNRNRLVTVSKYCLRTLSWWKQPAHLRLGVRLGAVTRREVVTTDASNHGWGGVWNGRGAQGVWRPPWLGRHINLLELQAVFLTLQFFLEEIRGRHLLVRTDNTTVVAYINHQGGTRSPSLNKVANRLLVWAHTHLLSLRAVHLPGVVNIAADLLSRQVPGGADWRLHPEVVSLIWKRFGRAEIDLFASQESTHCTLWFSIMRDEGCLGVDALAHQWPARPLYAFPPIALLPLCLEKIRQDRATVLLVAPHWPKRAWFASLMQLLCGQPWQLPSRRDLLSQAQGALWHHDPLSLQLWVWPLSGSI